MQKVKTNILDLKIGDYLHYKGQKRKITSIEIPYQHLRIIGLDSKLFVRYMTDKTVEKYIC